jgi:ABC-2 type transport system permease protein
MTYYLFLILCSLVYLIIMRVFGKPDWGQVLSSYIGMIFMGFMFVSVGLFYSACTREQIVAALASIITLGILVSLSYLSAQVPVTILNVPTRAITEYLAVGTHISDFARGSIQLTNIVYFLGFSFIFLFWTYVVLESRKWR